MCKQAVRDNRVVYWVESLTLFLIKFCSVRKKTNIIQTDNPFSFSVVRNIIRI